MSWGSEILQKLRCPDFGFDNICLSGFWGLENRELSGLGVFCITGRCSKADFLNSLQLSQWIKIISNFCCQYKNEFHLFKYPSYNKYFAIWLMFEGFFLFRELGHISLCATSLHFRCNSEFLVYDWAVLWSQLSVFRMFWSICISKLVLGRGICRRSDCFQTFFYAHLNPHSGFPVSEYVVYVSPYPTADRSPQYSYLFFNVGVESITESCSMAPNISRYGNTSHNI